MPDVTIKVKLLHYTPEPESVVAMAARLCYSDADIGRLEEQVNKKDQSAFVKKLMDLGHMSTIEHVSFTFGIEGVSRSLLAQITRHRLASFSVKSQRYVGAYHDEGTFNYIIPPAIKALGQEAVNTYQGQMQTLQSWYNEWILKLGNNGESANEDARFILPNAAETKMIMTMNARELLHFFTLRCCNRAQWEIRALAEQMVYLVKPIAPQIFAFAGPSCVKGACREGKMSCGKSKEMREKYTAQP